MKTLLYKPLFINPQAYYVFPNINGRLEPKTGSGKEPAIFVGNIEVKTIAHGDIGKKQYFYNTNEIDLSAFSNSLVRISLYTSRGNVVLGEWNLDVVEGESENYIDPEVLASLVAVCICDGKSNDDPDRAVIKNLVDPDNPFVISNAAFKLNSGYGKYEEDFTTWRISKPGIVSTINVNSIHITRIESSLTETHAFFENVTTTKKFNIKLKISGLTSDMKCNLNNENTVIKEFVNGVNEISVDLVAGWYGFMITSLDGSVIGDCDITIEQIPSHQGALVTDGVDDLIVSQRTSLEMIGGDNRPFTVISMISVINNSRTYYNNMVGTTKMNLSVVNSTVLGKTGIFGYTSTELNTNPSVVNNILGDKNDYSTRLEGASSPVDRRFSVTGYLRDGTPTNVSSIAWYWTFIANKVLTTDQINQVISYFNLDKYVKPDIIYDTIRQGITNENHASFNDELVDFSGNGHNMKLYNLNWDKQSGIGSYPFSFKDYNYFSDRASVSVNKSDFVLTANFDGNNFLEINTKNTEVPSFKIKAEGIDTITNGRLAYRIAASDGSISVKYISEDGEYEIPGSPLTENAAHSGFYVSGGINDNVRVKVTIIPDYEGALVSDGIDDYGKVENLPIYKDYTVVADREMLGATNGGVFLKGEDFREGAFSFDYTNESSSFGGSVQKLVDTKRLISYQSKYVNNGININAGTATDTDKLWLAKLGNSNRYSKLALWSFLLFPYSLSEFLLERQLKRYKLGTLYPNMVEFRPIVKSNRGYSSISYSVNPGEYISVDSMVTITVTLSNTSDKLIDVSCNAISDISISGDNGVYKITGKVVKSPQKINIVISSYLTMLNNDTLISNETLIKNE